MMAVEAKRLDTAVRAVIGAVLDDYLAGRIDRDKLHEQARRRMPGIVETYRQSAPRVMLACPDCAAPATTMVNGVECCGSCADRRRLAAPPRRVA